MHTLIVYFVYFSRDGNEYVFSPAAIITKHPYLHVHVHTYINIFNFSFFATIVLIKNPATSAAEVLLFLLFTFYFILGYFNAFAPSHTHSNTMQPQKVTLRHLCSWINNSFIFHYFEFPHLALNRTCMYFYIYTYGHATFYLSCARESAYSALMDAVTSNRWFPCG